jgi:hypothetical protein
MDRLPVEAIEFGLAAVGALDAYPAIPYEARLRAVFSLAPRLGESELRVLRVFSRLRRAEPPEGRVDRPQPPAFSTDHWQDLLLAWAMCHRPNKPEVWRAILEGYDIHRSYPLNLLKPRAGDLAEREVGVHRDCPTDVLRARIAALTSKVVA